MYEQWGQRNGVNVLCFLRDRAGARDAGQHVYIYIYMYVCIWSVYGGFNVLVRHVVVS